MVMMEEVVTIELEDEVDPDSMIHFVYCFDSTVARNKMQCSFAYFEFNTGSKAEKEKFTALSKVAFHSKGGNNDSCSNGSGNQNGRSNTSSGGSASTSSNNAGGTQGTNFSSTSSSHQNQQRGADVDLQEEDEEMEEMKDDASNVTTRSEIERKCEMKYAKKFNDLFDQEKNAIDRQFKDAVKDAEVQAKRTFKDQISN